MTALGNVPCNGCRACFLHDMIPLMPERGDLIWTFEHEVTYRVLNFAKGWTPSSKRS